MFNRKDAMLIAKTVTHIHQIFTPEKQITLQPMIHRNVDNMLKNRIHKRLLFVSTCHSFNILVLNHLRHWKSFLAYHLCLCVYISLYSLPSAKPDFCTLLKINKCQTFTLEANKINLLCLLSRRTSTKQASWSYALMSTWVLPLSGGINCLRICYMDKYCFALQSVSFNKDTHLWRYWSHGSSTTLKMPA